MSYENYFLISLFLTLVVEIPVLYLISRYFYKVNNNWNIVLSGILASVLTLPYFWFVLPAFIINRSIYVFAGESMIILVEAFIYFKLLKLKFKQALAISLIANLASILVGLLIG